MLNSNEPTNFADAYGQVCRDDVAAITLNRTRAHGRLQAESNDAWLLRSDDGGNARFRVQRSLEPERTAFARWNAAQCAWHLPRHVSRPGSTPIAGAVKVLSVQRARDWPMLMLILTRSQTNCLH